MTDNLRKFKHINGVTIYPYPLVTNEINITNLSIGRFNGYQVKEPDMKSDSAVRFGLNSLKLIK